MVNLTEREKQLYDFIAEVIERDGFPPSVRDICAALSIGSTSTVHGYLKRLEEKGCITREDGKSRALRLCHRETSARHMRVPIIGQIRAGTPMLAVENHDGYVEFAPGAHTYKSDELFALRIKGESMIGVGILDGDTVILRRTPIAENGSIVAALIEDEATLKTFYKENGHFRLQPENPTMEPIITDTVAVLGVAVAVIRRYE